MITRSDGKSHFYHGTTRKVVSAFGSLFNNLILERYDSRGTPIKSIKVPLVYASKSHFIAKMREEALDKDVKTNITLPTISFNLETFTYDVGRQLNPLNYRTKPNRLNPDLKDKEWSPVPYILNFNVSVFSNKTEDALQLVEQIIIWFTPEFNLPLKIGFNEEVVDVPVMLNGVTYEDNSDDGFDNNRLITYNLEFETKIVLFKPRTTPTIIENVIIDFHDDKGFSTPIEFGTITEREYSYLVDSEGNQIITSYDDLIISKEKAY